MRTDVIHFNSHSLLLLPHREATISALYKCDFEGQQQRAAQLSDPDAEWNHMHLTLVQTSEPVPAKRWAQPG